MDPDRLVWVGTGGPDGSGSGYLVGPRLVLTALHVVRTGGRWAETVVTRIGHPEHGGFARRDARVCWPDPEGGDPGEDAPDIALLWLDEPVTTTGGPVLWGRPAGTNPLPYVGAGFPAFAADAESPAQFEHLRGELSAVGTSQPGWVLDCGVRPAAGRGADRPWAGASGSAIFCHGRLVGVATEDNRRMEERRLHAARIDKALAEPGFARLIGRHGHPGTTDQLEVVTTSGGSVGGGGTAWPVKVGMIPSQATAFQPRSTVRERIERARSAGSGSVVLTQVLSGGGGVGKTQLAAAFATEALREGADLVVWAAATEVQGVITPYAQAAAELRLPGVTGDNPEADARALLEWLATTSQRWLVVLDDIADPAALTPWWPTSHTGTGWVLATTRLHDARLTGGGRTRVDVDIYSPEEAEAYLRERLTGDDMIYLLDDQAPALAAALGYLPLALGLAAAHMINEALTCAEYLKAFHDRRTSLTDALPETGDADGYGRDITVALLLSLGAAEAADTTGLAYAALCLVALLDPAGHPAALWSSEPVLGFLTAHSPGTEPVTAAQARRVLRLLHRYALITHDPRADPRAIRVHALTSRAVRERIPVFLLFELASTAARSLVHIWPNIDQPYRDLAAALRANTDVLASHSGALLWRLGGYTVFYRAGRSLLDAGLADNATNYWTAVCKAAEHLLGADHEHSLQAQHSLASAHWQAGRTQDAIALQEHVVAGIKRVLDCDHSLVLAALANLATCYYQEGRIQEAIAIQEQLVTDHEQQLGHDHRNTLAARINLAGMDWPAGRTQDAINLREQVAADSTRVLGHYHPGALQARNNLAVSYQRRGLIQEAIAIQEQLVTDHEQQLGHDHRNTLAARINLAGMYWSAGRTQDAVNVQEEALSGCERVLGADHPQTLLARANLAFIQGRLKDGQS
ncbi:tetratricopeptide repeat-containing serine protease family protein [Streptomyces sp. NPDC048717]|uniref:tetratricopeptide repeat-containing serine protease family protein n=1 Tax=Streptomyces sp. NPDC048717 TaxID=3154928 RepID=UPI00342063AC